jgi:hypothetical protein
LKQQSGGVRRLPCASSSMDAWHIALCAAPSTMHCLPQQGTTDLLSPPGDCCACGMRFERFKGVPPPNDGIDVSAPLSLSNRHGESSPPPVISPNDCGPPDGIALVPEAPDDRESLDPFAPGDCTNGRHERAREGKGRDYKGHSHHGHAGQSIHTQNTHTPS